MPIISDSWDRILKSQFEMQYMKNIQHRLKADIGKGLLICPEIADVFKAYRLTSYEDTKVIILGQDPYFSKHTADGLAFSAPYLTPSLDIIFKELKGSTGKVRTKSELNDWATQGVFLLNMVLTTVERKAMSHFDIGWTNFTKYTLMRLALKPEPMVVMLWGSQAIKYLPLFDGGRHLVLKAPHPASDTYGDRNYSFTGCKHFDMCNDYFQSCNVKQIYWGDPLTK